jgi:hypothetical protein
VTSKTLDTRLLICLRHPCSSRDVGAFSRPIWDVDNVNNELHCVLVITFDTRNSTILPLAINLAAVPLSTHTQKSSKTLLFRLQSIIRTLEEHDWMVAQISNVFQHEAYADGYVFEYLYYFATSVNTVELDDLNWLHSQWQHGGGIVV